MVCATIRRNQNQHGSNIDKRLRLYDPTRRYAVQRKPNQGAILKPRIRAAHFIERFVDQMEELPVEIRAIVWEQIHIEWERSSRLVKRAATLPQKTPASAPPVPNVDPHGPAIARPSWCTAEAWEEAMVLGKGQAGANNPSQHDVEVFARSLMGKQ